MYLTPYRLSNIYQNSPPYLLEDLWQFRYCCTSSLVFQIPQLLLETNIFFNFLYITDLFSTHPIINLTPLPPRSRAVLLHLLLAAKVNITRHWRTTEPHSLVSTLADLNLKYEKERIVARKHLAMHKFLFKWSSWLLQFRCTVQVFFKYNFIKFQKGAQPKQNRNNHHVNKVAAWQLCITLSVNVQYNKHFECQESSKLYIESFWVYISPVLYSMQVRSLEKSRAAPSYFKFSFKS